MEKAEYKNETNVLEHIQNFKSEENKKISDTVYRASVFFVTSNQDDSITEPEVLDNLRNRISTLVSLSGKAVSEDTKRKVAMEANDLNNNLLKIEKKKNNYELNKKIEKYNLYLSEDNKLNNLAELKNKEINYSLVTTDEKLHGMYPDWVNIKLYKKNDDNFIRVREFFKDNYFKENYLSINFKENYKNAFNEEINIREHKHSDDNTSEYSLKILVKDYPEMMLKTNFIINYIKINPRIKNLDTLTQKTENILNILEK